MLVFWVSFFGSQHNLKFECCPRPLPKQKMKSSNFLIGPWKGWGSIKGGTSDMKFHPLHLHEVHVDNDTRFFTVIVDDVLFAPLCSNPTMLH